jgi:hypothetical protein
MVFVDDRTQNVLDPLPCPICGGQPRVIDVNEVILQPIAEIVCTGDKNTLQRHAVAAYGGTLPEALTTWNLRAAPAPSREQQG